MNKKIIVVILLCMLAIGSLAPSFSAAQTVEDSSPDSDELARKTEYNHRRS